MAKGVRVSQLPGIAPPAVVALERSGILTIADLTSADFDRIAYILDDFNEARRLVHEASRIMNEQAAVAQPRNESAATHASRTGAGVPPHAPANGSAPSGQKSGMRLPRGWSGKEAGPSPAAASPRSGGKLSGDDLITRAVVVGAASDSGFAVDAAGVDRIAAGDLARRLRAAADILSHGGSPIEAVVVLLLERVEAGTFSSEQVRTRFSPEAAKLIEDCMALRAVPMLPSGRLPASYLDGAKRASAAARRVCAALLVQMAESAEAAAGAAYLLLHLQALEAGAPESLVALAAESIRGPAPEPAQTARAA